MNGHGSKIALINYFREAMRLQEISKYKIECMNNVCWDYIETMLPALDEIADEMLTGTLIDTCIPQNSLASNSKVNQEKNNVKSFSDIYQAYQIVSPKANGYYCKLSHFENL